MMKGVIVLLFLVFTTAKVNAQYRTYKNNYDVKNYSFKEGDRFQPAMAGVLAIIPGAGHVYANEPLRGVAFLGGMSTSLLITTVGFAIGYGGSDLGAPMMIGGVLSFVGIYIWNFFDAVKVAKIQNMAFRDLGVSFNFKPFINNSNNQLQSNSAGLSLQLNF